ncbi:MAG: sugar transferase [Pyrinomonadaceae bacterium]|nr:sugar transferase [Sphingobacteriaceae bacterium]
MLKRVFDVFCSLMGLILLLPFFVVVSAMIISNSKGSAFYRQYRVGRGGLDFTLLKFRTMYIDADKVGLLTVGSRDGRITGIGYWLRKYKIDEIPQLINVLIGEMSIVGPRPEVRKYVNLYNDEQAKVLNIKPGITDWASIRFSNENELLSQSANPERFYIETVMPSKLKLNMEYVNHNNVIIDLRIVLLTILKIIRH